MNFKMWLTERANWLVILFSAMLYIFIGIMSFEGGVAFKNFEGYRPFDWVLWGIITFLPAVLSVVISMAADKEGVRQGEVEIMELIKKYKSLVGSRVKYKPRSKAEYFKEGALKKGSIKFITTAVLSLVTGQLLLNMDLDSLIKIFINLCIWGGLAAYSFGKSYSYATSELEDWYLLEIHNMEVGNSADKPVPELR